MSRMHSPFSNSLYEDLTDFLQAFYNKWRYAVRDYVFNDTTKDSSWLLEMEF